MRMKRVFVFVKTLYYYLMCSYKIWEVSKVLVDDLICKTASGIEIMVTRDETRISL